MATAPDWYYKKPPNAKLRTGAGGVVARIENGQVLIALIRDRGDHEYVLPKGGVEPGETLEEAAAREIREEAGFRKLQLLGELGVAERLAGKRNDRRDWEVKWFDLDHLPEFYWREQQRLVHDNHRKIARLVNAAK